VEHHSIIFNGISRERNCKEIVYYRPILALVASTISVLPLMVLVNQSPRIIPQSIPTYEVPLLC